MEKDGEELIGLRALIGINNNFQQTLSMGRKELKETVGNHDNGFYSELGVDSAPAKRKIRFLKRRNPKRKEDFQSGQIIKWNEFLNEKGKNLGFEGRWANKFFRNPKRKPFLWGLQSSNVEDEEHRKELMEEGIQMREEDMEYLQ